jgi:sulfatase modifying factor 1
MDTMHRHSTTRSPGARRASFALMPVLAAGLMLSCRGEEPPKLLDSRGLSDRPMRALPRADSGYTIGFVQGCPEWMVRVNGEPDDYCIDRFEAHLTEVRGGKEEVYPSSVPPKPMVRYTARVAPNVRPQSSMNRRQAEEACWNAGKRLCTLMEWARACQGVQGFTYPYGDTEMPKICNTRKPHIISEIFGKDWGKHMLGPETNMVKGFLAKTGEYSGCFSSYGTYDMVGNLHEWVSDSVDERIMHSRPRIGPAVNHGFKVSVGNGIFMGGFYGTGTENGPGCSYMTTVHGPQQNDYSIGFRCCKDASPL